MGHNAHLSEHYKIQHFRLLVAMATNQNEEFVQLLYSWWRTTQQAFIKMFCQNTGSEIALNAYFHFSHFKSMETLCCHSNKTTSNDNKLEMSEDLTIALSEEKDKWKIKGQLSSSSLIPVHTIHLPIVHVCTKFQPSRPHSSWEKCDNKFQCLKIGERKMKK